MTGRLWAAILALALVLGMPMAAAAKGDCGALRNACEAAGFSDTGGRGKGVKVIRDCMNPLMDGVTPPGNRKLALPRVAPQIIADCKAVKAKKGKQRNAATVGKAAGAAPAPVKPLPAGAEPGPNIVLILVDDMSMNLMPDNLGDLAASMPNLARMRREGMTFDNYFVTDSLCCPSRTSILTGLLPHNSGVITNTPPHGGLVAFLQNGNEEKTFAIPLQQASYATAFMGKYMNGYQAESSGIPKGWTEWAVAGNAYANFDYTINHNGTIIAPEPHMTDTLSALGQAFIAASSGGPFLVELATFSPHAPYTPPARHADAFADITYPRTPAFAAQADDHAPQWLKDIPPLERRVVKKIDESYRLRVQSMMGIDDLIGDVRATLDALGLAEDTYVIFTSDNGYHLGEFSLRAGKMTPFDTDIKVPLVVIGPGIRSGSRNGDIAMNIDLHPTILDLAGLTPAPSVDGQSLMPALMGGAGPARSLAIVEHRQSDHNPDDPDASDIKAGDPPTYVALRFTDALYVEYLDGSGEVGYYDMTTDPDQLHNIAHTLSPARLKALHEAATANHTCAGAAECGAAQALQP
jgi:N-acetylglucosamine-6-sulfatase